MLLVPFSFQGNEKVYLECTKVRRVEGVGVLIMLKELLQLVKVK